MRKHKRILSIGLIFVMMMTLLPIGAFRAFADEVKDYVSLDTGANAIGFNGSSVTFRGATYELDENTIFLDYRLTDAQIAGNPYAFNDVHKAFAALKDGTAEKPMMLLTAPGVYWVDHPEDSTVRTASNGPAYNGTPIAVDLDVDYLLFYGLTDDYRNVVFAGSRGNTVGAEGFFTLFHIDGVGLRSENVTFGNYCNVDLVFPLDPTLNTPKRSNSITQAQLFNYTTTTYIDFGFGPWPMSGNGTDGLAINSAFVSRLNLLPFAQTYIDCHIESSGHASFYNGVYVNCDLEWYGQNFTGGGRFLGCNIGICSPIADKENAFHFHIVDGSGSGLAAINTSFYRGGDAKQYNIPVDIYWDVYPGDPTTRSYQYNVTFDGKPYVIQNQLPGTSVIIPEDSDLLGAYVIKKNGKDVYNIPNLLPGVDPQFVTNTLKKYGLEKGDANYYMTLPTTATLSTDASTIRSGEKTATLTFGAANNASSKALGKWTVGVLNEEMAQYAKITVNADGKTATLEGTNHTETAQDIIVVAKNEYGIEAAIQMTIEPAYTEAPTFKSGPSISGPADGKVTLDYVLDKGVDTRIDQSIINWYRCTDDKGSNPVPVSVSRLSIPEQQYVLSEGDIGFYLMATIEPKHNLSDPGPAVSAYLSKKIEADDVLFRTIDTTFRNMPTDPQPEIIPGNWLRDGYLPLECLTADGKPLYTPKADSWFFGEGGSGSAGYFGFDEQRGARMIYTPIGSNFGNMKTIITCAPDKAASQGFRDATHNFMDVFIKFDAATMTGYALRLERLSNDAVIELGVPADKANGGAAVAMSLVEYKNEVVTFLTKPIMTTSFLTECTLTLEAKDGVLTASIASSSTGTRNGDSSGYARDLTITAPYKENGFGATGMVFTGDVFVGGTNSVILYGWNTTWGDAALEADAEAVDFGEIAQKQPGTAKILKLNASELSEAISIEIEGEGFTAEPGEGFSVKDGGEIIVDVDPEAIGALNAKLIVSSGDVKVEIPLSAVVNATAPPNGDASALVPMMLLMMAAAAAFLALVAKKRA